tara:strand:- start:5414 stop:6205 length:792 start_codon:yes stop_codon:yes gene_type:complete
MFDEILIFAALGVIAGLLAGLFGIGGGLVIVPVLIGTFINLGFNSDIVVHMAIGSAIACIIFTGLSSAKAHNDKDSINFVHFKPVAIGITFGALAGALFAVQIKGLVLKIAIALFIFLMGIKILFNINLSSRKIIHSNKKSLFAGSLIGFFSSILGIGGGVFSVPYFKSSGLKLTTAIGTSAACGVPIAIFGTIGYVIAGIGLSDMPKFSLGYIYGPAVLGVSMTSIFAAKYGADLAHYLTQEALNKLLAAWFFIVSIYMFIV